MTNHDFSQRISVVVDFHRGAVSAVDSQFCQLPVHQSRAVPSQWLGVEAQRFWTGNGFPRRGKTFCTKFQITQFRQGYGLIAADRGPMLRSIQASQDICNTSFQKHTKTIFQIFLHSITIILRISRVVASTRCLL